MVARIRTGKNLKGAVNYNENKVKQGRAVLLHAIGYPKEAATLSLNEKVSRLQNLAALNTRTVTNCLHISLNFLATETINDQHLKDIAESYMEKIGFGRQPYLVYKHDDAAHPHVHIVTTNIRRDGSRISLHNLGSVQSEKARKEIEVDFGLVRAGEKVQSSLQLLTPITVGKTAYGKAGTHQAIKNVVAQVVSQYRFTSLHQLNAVLQLYNVRADPGKETSLMYGRGGLQYTLIDESGKRLGIPLNASSIPGKPTRATLEKLFTSNAATVVSMKRVLRLTLEKALPTVQENLSGFTARLQKIGIDVVLRSNEEGFLYGVTYVDHHNKAVFNGNELGKQFSAAAIRKITGLDVLANVVNRFVGETNHLVNGLHSGNDKPSHAPKPKLFDENLTGEKINLKEADISTAHTLDIVQGVTDAVVDSSYVPWQLRRKKKRPRPGQQR